MAKKKSAKKKGAKPDRKRRNPTAGKVINGLLTFIIIAMVVFAFLTKDDRGVSLAEKAYRSLLSGEATDAVQQTIERQIVKATDGREKPPASEIEAHFQDRAGALPVDADFDSDPGEICGNGKTYYCTSKPPKKPIPAGWVPPPKPGTDPSYDGPAFDAPFKESPYAMPSSKRILARPLISDLGDRDLSAEVTRAASKAKGKIGYLGARAPDRHFTDPVVSRIRRLHVRRFKGDDDAELAKQLLAEGYDFLLVDRTYPPVKPWMEEKMSSLALRARDGIGMDWFHPVVLGSGMALYRIAKPLVISNHIKRLITMRLRSRLTGHEVGNLDFAPAVDPVDDKEFWSIVSLRWRSQPWLKGRKLIKKLGRGKSVVEAVDAAAWKIEKDWPRIRGKILGNRSGQVNVIPMDLGEAVAQMEIEVDVLYDICTLTDRTPQNLLWYIELGLEGVGLRKADDFFFLEPSYAVQMEIAKEVIFLERMLMKFGLSEFLRDPRKKRNKNRGKVLYEGKWEDDTTYRFQRFRTINWIERPGGREVVETYRGVPLKTIWDVNRSALVRSLELGADWLMRNQKPDGQYAYKYTPTNRPGRRWTAGGNIVRHALNPYTLLMVNKIKPDPMYVESAKKGIEFTLKFLRRQGDRCVICHRDPPARYYNAKIGTVAVTILSILKLGDVADISEYDDVLRCLGEELLYMQDKNGHFWQYDVPEDHPYFGAESTIAPGEFIFALSRLYTHYRDERYKAAVDRALPYYMKAWRKLRSERTREGIYDEEHRVNLIGIVPWLVTAMNDLHAETGDSRYADIAFEQQDWIDEEFFWYLNRTQYPDYAGASFKVYRELPAINSCQYTEGAAAAYDLAKRIGKDEEKRRQVVVLGMRFCLQTQYDSYDSTFFLPVPEEAMGGYRYTLGHLRLRNDYNYHAMAAIAQGVEYLEPTDYPAERPLRIPPVLRELLAGRVNPTQDAPRPEKEAVPVGGTGEQEK
ncbi:MAG: hypothetical protein GY762_01395 [Proteobacteria bacterium]|nr:hypothetical protein [Pseudomonadota bacterium]